jgi:hypothetical protein
MATPEPNKCEICGEPMPPGDQMFKFHGYSGPCPKPPLPKPKAIDTIAISGVWLRKNSADIELLVEVDGHWRQVIVERCYDINENAISHITEPTGIRQAPLDPLTEPRQ